MTKEFGIKLPTYADKVAGETARIAQMKAQATPPSAMQMAPVAPARGVMRLVNDYEVAPGGTRRQTGAHWVEPTRLDVINAKVAGEAAGQGDDTDRSTRADVFSPAQIAMAARYRDLVEWLAGSGIKCSRLERGSGGSGASGDFATTFSERSGEVDQLRAAIGDAVILSPRRHMDRDNARKVLTVRVALDAMVLKGWSMSKVITRHGWAAKGDTRRQVRDAIRGALDRMQGYH